MQSKRNEFTREDLEKRSSHGKHSCAVSWLVTDKHHPSGTTERGGEKTGRVKRGREPLKASPVRRPHPLSGRAVRHQSHRSPCLAAGNTRSCDGQTPPGRVAGLRTRVASAGRPRPELALRTGGDEGPGRDGRAADSVGRTVLDGESSADRASRSRAKPNGTELESTRETTAAAPSPSGAGEPLSVPAHTFPAVQTRYL